MGLLKGARWLTWRDVRLQGTRSRDGRLGPARKGVGRLVAACPQPPLGAHRDTGPPVWRATACASPCDASVAPACASPSRLATTSLVETDAGREQLTQDADNRVPCAQTH